MRHAALALLAPLAASALYLQAAVAGSLWPGSVAAVPAGVGAPLRVGLFSGPIHTERRVATVWQAATGDDAVLRLDVVGSIAPDALGVNWLDLAPTRLAALTGAILDDLADPAPLPDAGFTSTDAVFPARGRFHLFTTCNVWVARTQRAAGHPFGAWTPTPFAVSMSLWRFRG